MVGRADGSGEAATAGVAATGVGVRAALGEAPIGD